MTNAPFFIVGSGRSGSTLLRMILASHSRLSIPPETWFARLLVKQFSLDRPLTSEEVTAATQIIVNHYRWPDLEIESGEYLRRTRVIERPVLGDLVGAIYRQQLENDHKARWGDKTPGYIEIIPQLAKMFPGARFIHLIRDGRDVAKSFQATGWFGPWLHENMREWNEALEYDSCWRDSPFDAQILRVHYEDLVRETEPTVRRICQFLDEPFEQKMLLWQENIDHLVPERELRIHEKLKRRPEETDVDRWKREMSTREIFISEAFMGKHLAQAGYERRFSGKMWTPAFALVRWYCQTVLPILGAAMKAVRMTHYFRGHNKSKRAFIESDSQ